MGRAAQRRGGASSPIRPIIETGSVLTSSAAPSGKPSQCPARRSRPVPAPELEIVSQQRAQLVDQVGRGRRVQPMAAVVDPYAVHLEAAGQPAHDVRALEHHHRVAAPGRAPGGRQAGRAGAKDDDGHRGRTGHPPYANRRWAARLPPGWTRGFLAVQDLHGLLLRGARGASAGRPSAMAWAAQRATLPA